jgi:hypothetical protein
MAATADALQEQAPAESGRRHWWWPEPWRPAAVLALVAFGGLAAFLVPLRGLNLAQVNGLGLISVLPLMSLLGITAAVLAFSVGLCLPRAYPAVLGATLAGIVICLNAVTVFTEAEPRFPTAYWIAGFVDYVSRTGHSAPGVSAYFSWPGFFSGMAFVEHVAGDHNLIPLMRLWPVTIDLACLVALYFIMRNLRASWRAKWLAAFLFTVGNWVGQDYFSPQSFNYVLYLAFIAILLTWFNWRPQAQTATPQAEPDRGHGIMSRWRSSVSALVPGQAEPDRGHGIMSRWRSSFSTLVPGENESAPIPRAQRAIVLAILLGIFVLSVTSHQLTPFVMILACLGLIVVRRCRITGLPVLMAVIVAAWISFAAVGFWSGHISSLFGGLGHLGGNLTASVSDRITGTAQHRFVLDERSASAAVFLLVAGAGLLRRRRRVVDDRVVITLMCVPFLAFGAQSYGGEIALRVYLFALPAAAILAAYLFFPATRDEDVDRRWHRFIPVAICAVTLLFGFFIARYGNEAFERTPAGEVTAFDYLYAHDQNGERLLWLSEAPAVDNTPEMPWAYQDIEKINYIPELAPRDPASVAATVAALRAAGPGSYLITTSTQEAYLNQAASYPADWGKEFRASMAATPGVYAVVANPDAVIYALRWPPGTPVRPFHLGANGPAVRSTPWTPVGLVILSLLLLVLVAREFVRVCLDAPRLTRLLTLASLPMLTLFFVVVIMRFVVLS